MSIFEDRPFIPKAEPKPALKDRAKVARYRAGKAPEWVDDQDDQEEDLEPKQTGPIKVEKKADRRLERLQGGTVDREEALRRRKNREVVAEIVSVGQDKEEGIKEEDDEEDPDERRRRARRATTDDDVISGVVSIKNELPEEEDDDEADARRARARQQYLERKKREEEEEKESAGVAEVAEEEAEEDEEEESEYETDSEEEWPNRPTIKPVFVSKQARETLAERDKRIEEEALMEELRLQQLEERKEESLELLKQQIARDRAEEKELAEGADDERVESDEEDEDEAKEYELWKQREIERIKRDRAERLEMEKEKEETERRRNMTDAEIRELDKDKFVKEKKQLRFMQKYYHKGAFFADNEDVQNKDYSGATGEDLIDKSALPKVMQVKNFGRSGRTKYTHLVDQDTSARDAPWAIRDDFSIQNQQKMGGLHGGFERPALKKRKEM